MLLMDDDAHSVLEPAAQKVCESDKLYDFELMTGGRTHKRI